MFIKVMCSARLRLPADSGPASPRQSPFSTPFRTETGRGERARPPLADLNQPEAGKCAEGAQASSEDCFLLAYGEYPPLADFDILLPKQDVGFSRPDLTH